MEQQPRISVKRHYIDVMREFLHLIPSQSSQGSEPTQLGGVFFQVSIRDKSLITALEITAKEYDSVTEILYIELSNF